MLRPYTTTDFFLVATPVGAVTPLGAGMPLSEESVA